MPEIDDAEAIRGWQAVPPEFAAEFGDDGDLARRLLLNPALLSLLGNLRERVILDAGCGQGYLSRMLARRGARVTGLEPATPLIAYALAREEDEHLGIRYIQGGLGDYAEPNPLYDTVVANMVLMDIPDYRRSMAACFGCLRRGGDFIFSLTHPCFEGSDSEYWSTGTITTREYFAPYSIPQRWGARYHRPLSHYLMAAIGHGGYIRAVIEPQLDQGSAQLPPEQHRNLHVPGFIVIAVRKG
jgi:2-polyprenyl-3-methyl-5-hydroxy-6-metoxy-1,4-benzoquinol methylase